MNGQGELPWGSAELFPMDFDLRRDAVTFVRLNREDYCRASFLDARIVTPQTVTHAAPWPDVAAGIVSAGLAERCDFIFHIGHVGSTLISRLAGAHPAVLSLREPQVLRTFARLRSDPAPEDPAWTSSDYEDRLGGCLKLLSRTFDAQQRSLVKATSFVSEIAAELLTRPPGPNAVMIHVAPETYIATILGGPNSRREANMLTPGRLRRLHRRLGVEAWRGERLSEGETLALGWACEMAGLVEAADASHGRTLQVDFDRFLEHPRDLLSGILRHLGINSWAEEVNAILAGPDMRRYSKAPEHDYDAALRLAVLTEARAAQGMEIRKGLAWLERAARDFPVIARAVELAARAARNRAAPADCT